MRRALPLLAVLALAGCGGSGRPAFGGGASSPAATSGAAKPADVARRWADTLRRGDVDGAARLFALPSVVSNGTPPLKLTTLGAVREFNRSLPCGARYLGSRPHHGFLLVTFELVNRTGPGAVRPCRGEGDQATTAFLIRGGKIVQWRRATDPGAPVNPT